MITFYRIFINEKNEPVMKKIDFLKKLQVLQ